MNGNNHETSADNLIKTRILLLVSALTLASIVLTVPACRSGQPATVITNAENRTDYSQATKTQVERLGPGDHSLQLTSGGYQRTYIIHVPPPYDSSKQWPVVIMFHGGGGNAKQSMLQTHWDTKANQEGFLAVFPEGTRPNPSQPAKFNGNPQSWNDGSERGIKAAERKIADVEFVSMMISDIMARFSVDERRIYATGFSNGAALSFRLARELSSLFAAFAPVSGGDWLVNESPKRPVPLLYLTGTADPLNPINGGEIYIANKSYGVKPPTMETIAYWVKTDGCLETEHVIYNKNGAKGIAYSTTSGSEDVVLYTFEGHGHFWPGGATDLPESIAGKNTAKLNGTDIIWDFFTKHPKR